MKPLISLPCDPPTRKQMAGFTLMEVIVVVAIFGVMAAIAIPAISTWLPNYRLKSEARLVYSHLQRAKSEAVKRNANVEMAFTAGTGTPCQGGSYTFTANGTIVLQYSVSEGMCLSSTTTDGEIDFPKVFTGRGLNGTTKAAAPDTVVPSIVILSHIGSTRTYTITQSVAGGIRLE